MSVPARRSQVALATGRGLSQRRACTLIGVGRSALRYRSAKAERDARIVARVQMPQSDSYSKLKAALLAEGNDAETRGLIGQGQKVESKVRVVAFKPDPTAVMSVTIVYYRR